MSAKLYRIGADAPFLAPHLARMARGSGGRFDASDIDFALRTERFQAWAARDGHEVLGVMLTEIIAYPKVRALRLIGISARAPRRWMHLLAEVEAIAKRDLGCGLIECLHMPGHERLLTTGGWKVWHYLSAKEL